MKSLLVLLVATAPAVAQPAPQSDEKSPATATTLAVAGSVLPFLLMLPATDGSGDVALPAIGAVASLFTPSLGHWYSGKFATWGMGVRLVGLAVGASAVANSFSENSSDGAGVMIGLGAALYVSGMIVDIATAGSHAHKVNTRSTVIAPTVINDRGRTTLGIGFVTPL